MVGLIELRLNVVQAMSLKDKRRVIKGFKDRVRHRHNVSIAEVGAQDSHRLAVLAVAMVGNDRQYLEGALRQIEKAAAMHRDMILIDSTIEWI
ncbi:MAG: DUF503 domain-containing protein [Planctomycetes bacterium]|nr:DUF503 domain-containing protein [Planctomycetota bacterium]